MGRLTSHDSVSSIGYTEWFVPETRIGDAVTNHSTSSSDGGGTKWWYTFNCPTQKNRTELPEKQRIKNLILARTTHTTTYFVPNMCFFVQIFEVVSQFTMYFVQKRSSLVGDVNWRQCWDLLFQKWRKRVWVFWNGNCPEYGRFVY